uniref:Uncharacterized protein n=1 Tax=Oryza barthii TaxID=65489 RepID=A0A0D3HBQ5_9ORYZ
MGGLFNIRNCFCFAAGKPDAAGDRKKNVKANKKEINQPPATSTGGKRRLATTSAAATTRADVRPKLKPTMSSRPAADAAAVRADRKPRKYPAAATARAHRGVELRRSAASRQMTAAKDESANFMLMTFTTLIFLM